MITCDDENIGYGAVKGNEDLKARDTVFEFYMIPSYRHLLLQAFKELLQVSKVGFIESQTNALLLTSLLYQFEKNIPLSVGVAPTEIYKISFHNFDF